MPITSRPAISSGVQPMAHPSSALLRELRGEVAPQSGQIVAVSEISWPQFEQFFKRLPPLMS